MFKKFGFENMLKGNSASGVEIVLLPDGKQEINLLTLKREKSLLHVEFKALNVVDFSALANLLDKKSPVVIVINGKGIIHKKIALAENESFTSMLNKVLPNANVNDFYFQKYDLGANQTYVSIVRASLLDELLDDLKKNDIVNIEECYLGPFVCNNIISLRECSALKIDYLEIPNYKLLIRDNSIQEIVPAETIANTIKLGDQVIEVKSTISFAAAFSHFHSSIKGVDNSEALDSLKNEFIQKQKFQLRAWILLISTLLTLMINYFVFTHYWETNNKIQTDLISYQSALEKYDKFKSEYDQKKTFLEQNGLLQNSRTSFYADQIAASLPSSMRLTLMNIHPLKKKDPSDPTAASFSFENKTIKVLGKCNRNTELNNWLKKLKTKNWVSDVILISYKQEEAREEGLFILEIIID
jgi:hypothetical protein